MGADAEPSKIEESGKTTQLALRSHKSAARRACDNCFKGREKCTYATEGAECDRCKRLGRLCAANRPVRQAGRPRRRQLSLGSKEIVQVRPSIPYSIPPFGTLFARLQPIEEMMVSRFTNPANFVSLFPAPRIGVQMYQQALCILLSHFEVIHDGYFAMYEAFAAAVLPDALPGYDFETNMRRGTVALSKFRRLPCPIDRDDFAPWLWLGNAIVLHANFALGSNSFPLRRYMLTHLLRLGEAGRAFRSHPVVVSMAALDIFNCLLYGETPIMDFPDADYLTIDPFFELCAPILRMLFGLCNVVSHTTNATETGVADLLTELEPSIQSWQPTVSPELHKELTTVEAIHALTQTRVYKTMALLYIHRLKYPFGSEDTSATSMSRSILSDLDLAVVTAGATPKWVALPFLIAAFDVIGVQEREKIINDSLVYTGSMSSKTQASTQTFLQTLWLRRDTGPPFRWIDAMSSLPEVFVGA